MSRHITCTSDLMLMESSFLLELQVQCSPYLLQAFLNIKYIVKESEGYSAGTIRWETRDYKHDSNPVHGFFPPLADINECKEGRHLCNRLTEECVNTLGDYWCAPLLGPPIITTTTPIPTTTTPVVKVPNFTIPPIPTLPPRPELPTPACPSGTLFDKVTAKCKGKASQNR